MFATGAKELKIQYITLEHKLISIGEYRPYEFPDQKTITNISWSYDNNYIALLFQTGQLHILNTKDRNNIKCVHIVKVSENIKTMTFKRRTKRIVAVGTVTGKVIFYDTKNRLILKEFDEFTSPILKLDFNCLDEQVLVACKDYLHLLEDPECVNEFRKTITMMPYSSVAKFHPTLPNVVGYSDANEYLTLFNTKDNIVISSNQEQALSIREITFTNEAKLIVVLDSANQISVFEYPSLFFLFYTKPQCEVHCIDVSPDDLFIAAGLDSGHLSIYQIWNPKDPIIHSKVHDDAIARISFVYLPKMKTLVNLNNIDTKTSFNMSEFSNTVGDSAVDLYRKRFKNILVKNLDQHLRNMDEKLEEQCSKFQMYVFNEIDVVHNSLARWDVFKTCENSDFLDYNDNTNPNYQ